MGRGRGEASCRLRVGGEGRHQRKRPCIHIGVVHGFRAHRYDSCPEGKQFLVSCGVVTGVDLRRGLLSMLL
jgi:hypothetical protein